MAVPTPRRLIVNFSPRRLGFNHRSFDGGQSDIVAAFLKFWFPYQFRICRNLHIFTSWKAATVDHLRSVYQGHLSHPNLRIKMYLNLSLLPYGDKNSSMETEDRKVCDICLVRRDKDSFCIKPTLKLKIYRVAQKSVDPKHFHIKGNFQISTFQ